MTRIDVASLALALVVALRPAPATAQEMSLRDYVHTSWTHHDGVPINSPRRILQTTDGYLWIVTRDEGLLRFDGMRFVPVPLPCGEPRVASSDHGGLWIVCDGRLLRRSAQGAVLEVQQTFLQPQNRAQGLFVDSRARPWLLGRSVAYLQPDGMNLREFPGLTEAPIMTVAEDSDGALWVSDTNRVVRLREGHTQTLPLPRVSGLTRAPSGGVLGWSKDTVWYLNADSHQVFLRAPPGITFSDFHGGMAIGSEGELWAGTRESGIALIQGGRIETLPDTNAMSGFVSTVFVDREHNIWVGAASGLHRFRKPRARLMSSLAGRLTAIPAYAFVDSHDAVWVGAVGSTGSLTRLNPTTGTWQSVKGRYHSIGEDRTGRIWLGTASDIGYLSGGAFVPVRDVAMASVGTVRSFKTDGHGDLWALATGVGVYRVTPGPPRRVFDAPNSADDFLVSSRHGTWIVLDKSSGGGAVQHVDGHDPVFHDTETMSAGGTLQTIVEVGDSIWIGAFGGLLRWRHGKWTTWTSDHGLPGKGGVFEIAADRFDRLWLMTHGGIVVLPRAQLDATPDGSPGPLTFARIGSLDRVAPHVGGMRTSPRVSSDRRGRLHFVTFDSVAIVDPLAVTESAITPSIALESIAVDNELIDLTTRRRFIEPALMQFEYTSVSLHSPENIRFRYKLEGQDPDWIEAGGQRRVTYGTLKPGAYTFRVIGSGSEGVWNEEGASYAFQIVPLFWHTWWFQLTFIGLGAVAVYAVYLARMNRLTRKLRMRFEERLAERTRIARDLHDTLLQGTLAVSLHMQVASDALADAAESNRAIGQALPPLRRAQQLLSQVIDEGRTTVKGLRADPAPRDLVALLYQASRDQPNRDDIDFRVVVEGAPRALNPRISDEICGIAREAIVNAYQHSSARHIEVEVAYTRTHFRCIVRDDGRGIDTRLSDRGREGHWGLIGMRERAAQMGAELNIHSGPSAGTEVEILIKGRHAFADQIATRRWARWPRIGGSSK